MRSLGWLGRKQVGGIDGSKKKGIFQRLRES
jgi:hypothetical protein